MPEVFSPQVITREVDLSTVAPSVSSAITAIVGGAVRGPVNTPTFVSTPDAFVDTFGEPTPTSFLGYTALNFLRQGNQLWVNRIASEGGDDPIKTATTDTSAVLTSGVFTVTDFPISGNLEIQIDGGTPLVVSLNATNASTIENLVATLNAAFSTVEPKLATAVVYQTNRVRITTQSQDGPSSTIDIIASPVAQFTGNASGARTVTTSRPKTSATLQSSSGTVIDTTVVNAAVKGNIVPVGRTFNVSKQGREAFGIIGVQNSAAFNVSDNTVGTLPYNEAALTVTSNPTATDTLVVTVGATVTTFTFVAGSPSSNTDIQIGVSTAATAQNIANHINNAQLYATIDGVRVPAVNVTASFAGSVVTLRQITPPDFATSVVVSSSASGWGSIDNGVDAADDVNTVGAHQTLKGGDTSVEYVQINIPDTVTATAVEAGSGGVDVAYFFVSANTGGAGTFDADPSNTVSQIAASLSDAIDSREAYFPNSESAALGVGVGVAQTYSLASTSSGSQVTVTTNGNIAGGLKAQGNDIGVDLSNINANAMTDIDLDASNTLTHGFNDRLGTGNGGLNDEYSFAAITVDGVTKAINFDTVPTSVIPNKHEATIAQIIQAINNAFGNTVASEELSGGGTLTRLVITSPTNGAEGSVSVGSSSNVNALIPVTGAPANPAYEQENSFDTQNETTGANTDLWGPYPDQAAPGAAIERTVVGGSGDNRLSFKVDGTSVDVFFTQSAALPIATAIAEINAAAGGIDTLFANVASLSGSGDAIVLTSPTAGAPPDFNSTLEITNTFLPVSGPSFATLASSQGTGTKAQSIRLEATTPGTWANGTVKVAFKDEDPLFSVPNSSRVDIFYNDVLVETFREVVVNPFADGSGGTTGQGTYIEVALNGVDGVGGSDFVRADFDDDLLDNDPDTLIDSEKIVPNTSALGNNPPYTLSGGGDGIDGITDADVIGVIDDGSGSSTGLQSFSDKERILVNLLAAPGFSSQNVQNELVSIAESRADLLTILDPPVGLTPEQVVDWHNGLGFGRTSALNTSYAATYGTWLTQFDAFNDIEVTLPPSAFILAQMALSDAIADPWFATAGLTRGRINNATNVLTNPTLGQRELMYGQGNRVNPIPNFVSEGIVVWGNRTLFRQDSALKEITVRRMLNFAKTIIELGAKVILFEPSDPISSKKLVQLINPVLDDIRRRRGLVSFKVVDATTERDRNLNRAVIKVFLEPTRTIEVIDIPFILTESGGSFAE